MALRYVDSFDHVATAQITLKCSAMTGVPTIVSGGRNSTNALELSAASTAVGYTIPVAHATGIVGVAIKPTSVSAAHKFLHVFDGGASVVHLDLQFNGTGQIIVSRGDGTVLATGTAVISTSFFTYVEFKWTINNTTGSVEVRLNGSAIADCSATNVDTQNAGTATWNSCALFGRDGSLNGNILTCDDFYLCDGSGSAPCNTFLGDCRAECLLPQTDAVSAGSNAGLTCSTGTDHGALVDESTPNSDTDYNSGTTVGVKDTYQFPSLSSAPSIIYGIQTCAFVKKTDAGAKTFAAVVRSGGTDYDGATVAATTSYTYALEVRESDPATSAAWDLAGIAAMQAGLKIIA